jgi:hypothetical protein
MSTSFFRYETGQLRKDLERVLVTEELKKLANGDVVEFEVSVSQEECQSARENMIQTMANKDETGKFVLLSMNNLCI